MGNNTNDQKPILVLNGTGKAGRRVVERLTARGLPVRIGSRSGEPRFDWEDRSTWNPVLEGVGPAYVSHRLDAIPGSAETLGSFAELAVESGVSRLVLMSGRGEEESVRGRRPRDSGADLTSCTRPGSPRTSARITCWITSSAARSRSLPGTRPTRSSTPTTSPTSRSRR